VNRAPVQLKAKRHDSFWAPSKAALVLTVFVLIVLAPIVGWTLWTSWASAVGKGFSLDFPVAIRTSLATQYETTLFLESNAPVPLVLEYDPPVVENLEQRVRWRCDRGYLEQEEATLRTRFFPPSRSALCTIEAEVGFYPKRTGGTSPTPVYSRKATLRVLSPSPGSLFQNGELDGFRIGKYLNPSGAEGRKTPHVALHPERFLPPNAFYLVDDQTRDLRVSRHLRLGDFALDFPWFSLGKRQYIALDYRLVRKIEDLIDELNRAGLPGESFRMICGFRPPSYNLDRIAQDGGESLKAPFSLHQYGRAVDFILDADGDLRLDDLNRDDKVTVRDTAVIVHHINVLDRRYRSQGVPLYGGVGIYDHHDFWERPVQTPYIHMDTRGFLDEEGGLIRWPAQWPDGGGPIAWSKL